MTKKRMKLAKPGKRFGAACIDGAIPVVLCIISMIAAPSRSTYTYDYSYNNQYSYGYREATSGSPVVMAIIGLLLLAYLVVELVFYAKAASIGKKILGLQVVSSIDGTPLGFGRMLYREFIVKQASSVLMLGYIWILVDEKHRGWHDKIMDTYVVDNKVPAAAPAYAPAPAAPGAPYTPAAPAQGMPAAAPAATPAAPAQGMPAAAPAPAPAAPAQGMPAAAPAPVSAAPDNDVTVDINVAPVPAAEETAPAIPKKPSIRLDIDDPAPAPVKADMSMKKEELLETAAGLGVSVNSRATKAEIIEAINKASK